MMLFLVVPLIACLTEAAPRFDRGAIGSLVHTKRVTPSALTHDYALVANIYIGTPAQNMTCLLDTGIADVWVPHSFRADNSSTYGQVGDVSARVEVKYGAGSLRGHEGQDSLAIGGITLQSQAFMLAEDPRLPEAKSWDGICGLGWKSLAKTKGTLYQRLQEQGVPAMFSFAPGPIGERPHLRVGAIEEAKVKPGTLVWAKAEPMSKLSTSYADERRYWLISGGVAVTQKASMSARFVFKTGINQVLLAPPRVYDTFMASLLPDDIFNKLCGADAGQGGLVACNCSVAEMSYLPPLRMHLGDRDFALPIQNLFRRVPARDGSKELCLLQIQPNTEADREPEESSSVADDGGMHGGSALNGGMGLMDGFFGPPEFQEQESRVDPGDASMEEVWVIGGVFLEHFVTIFDFDNARVGFAETAPIVEPEPAEDAKPASGALGWGFLGLRDAALRAKEVEGLGDATSASHYSYLGLACSVCVAIAGVILLGRTRSCCIRDTIEGRESFIAIEDVSDPDAEGASDA